MQSKSLVLTLITTAAIGMPSGAQAATHVVGPDGAFSDIQPAIEAALDGDVIQVSPGTYSPIEFLGKAITVTSTDGAEATVIDAGGSGTAVLFAAAEPASALLLGFTITGGTSSGLNVVVGAAPTIRSCIFEGNSGEDGGGANIWGPATLRENLFIDNSAVYGGGLYLNNINAVIDDNEFIENSAASGGGVYINAGNLSKAYISDNSVSGQGGGISASSGSVTNALILNNSAIYGGGLHISGGTTFRITNSTIVGNAATESFGSGGGVHINGGASGSLRNMIITGNTATDTGGVYSDGSNPGIFYSNITGNSGGNYGGNAQDSTGQDGNISTDPLFSSAYDYALASGSPSIDSGDPSFLYNDPDGSNADMGFFGGPNAEWDAYIDADGDGVNLADADCDDTSALNFPGNEESCDGLDNNCDGEADEGLFEDADLDGFTLCDGDCDDNDGGVFPGNTEIPDDGVDQDCDGSDETTSGCNHGGQSSGLMGLMLVGAGLFLRRRNR